MADTVVPGVFPGRLAGVMPLQDLALLVGGQLAALTGAVRARISSISARLARTVSLGRKDAASAWR